MSSLNPTLTIQSPTRPTKRRPRVQFANRRPRVLIVDAERVVAEMLSLALHYDGFEVMTAYDAATAMSAARRFRPDVVILDRRLPDMDGIVLLCRLRERHPALLTILVHPKPGGHRRVAKEAGDDAWLFKPFSIEDALAEVRRMLRNNGADDASLRSAITVGDLVLDEDDHRVWRGGENIVLTPTEFKLMRFFARNAYRALSTREILGRVWHYDYTGQSTQVRLYVSYLRRRVDDGRTPTIHTLRRNGYVFRPPSV